MRFVIQRVQHAEVKVDGEVTGSIGKGFLVLIGVAETDNREIADKEIVRPSSTPVNRIWRMNCTNISSAGAAKVFPR